MAITITARPSLSECLRPQPCTEREMVAQLIRTTAQSGVRVDPLWIVNCFVAFKSTPLTILAGPEQSGKSLVAEHLMHMLTQDVWRNQMMLGHAWWAEGTQVEALFTEAQTRWNSCKVLALIEEASLPENSDFLFIGWLDRIGPAELAGYFSSLAFQFRHNRLMQLPSLHLTEPIPCPPNFSLLGTMDSLRLEGLDEDLLSMATLIPWPAVEVKPPADLQPDRPIVADAERLFLRSCIRSEKAAFEKLHRIQGWRPGLMWPLCAVEDLLRQHEVVLPVTAMGQAMVYVANAWSVDGEGLFDPAPARNMSIAMDFAITQSLLMHACDAIRDSAGLRWRLAGALSPRFPHSVAFLHILHDEEPSKAEMPGGQALQALANPGIPSRPATTTPVTAPSHLACPLPGEIA